MKALKIRNLRGDELDEAWNLHRKGFPYLDVISREQYFGYRSGKNLDFDRVIVAVRDDGLVGEIVWGMSGRTGFIDSFVVDPRYRRQGIGTRLLREAEKHAKRRGVTRIDLGVKGFSKPAIALCEKLGYRKLSKSIS